LRSVEGSLRRLGTEWIDVYYLHYPDPETPIDETLDALDELIEAGKIRAMGFSNVNPTYVAAISRRAAAQGMHAPVVCQNPLSLLAPEAESTLLPALEKLNVGFVPAFPLASGLLTGKYNSAAAAAAAVQGSLRTRVVPRFAERFLTETNLAKLELLERLAREQNMALLDVAVGWLLANPQVASVIAGATSADQVRQNAAAADWRGHATQIDNIDSALRSADMH
jgi:aryl-alcohol dehydrogenase-like predicted oxidoreductase